MEKDNVFYKFKDIVPLMSPQELGAITLLGKDDKAYDGNFGIISYLLLASAERAIKAEEKVSKLEKKISELTNKVNEDMKNNHELFYNYVTKNKLKNEK